MAREEVLHAVEGTRASARDPAGPPFTQLLFQRLRTLMGWWHTPVSLTGPFQQELIGWNRESGIPCMWYACGPCMCAGGEGKWLTRACMKASG